METRNKAVRDEYIGGMDELLSERQKHEETVKKLEIAEKKLKIAQKQIEIAQKTKNTILSNISHELKTPLHIILGFTNLGIKAVDRFDKTALLDHLNIIKQSGNTLKVLVNDLLELAEMESEGSICVKEAANLFELIVESQKRFKTMINKRKILIDLQFPAFSTDIFVDRQKIQRVMDHLLLNALTHSHQGKKISVTFEMDSIDSGQRDVAGIKVTIRDQGVGIPENELGSVFEKFTESSRTKSKTGGRGIGLAICEKIILAHEGLIWAENGEEEGANFHVVLPGLIG